MVALRGGREFEGLRRAGDLVARILGVLGTLIRPGTGLDGLDRFVEDFLRSEGAASPYRGYRTSSSAPPFPGPICASVKEQVVHGFPTGRKLREGDVVGVDVEAVLGGWVGDACYTYPAGGVSGRTRRLLEVGQECLRAGVAEVKPGRRMGDIGAAVLEVAEGRGYGVVRELGGHGVGKTLHEEPFVDHFGSRGRGLRLREGMVFTIEPMLNEGTPEIRLLGDGWTIVTADGRLSAQYEHTVAVTADGRDILTPWHHYLGARDDAKVG